MCLIVDYLMCVCLFVAGGLPPPMMFQVKSFVILNDLCLNFFIICVKMNPSERNGTSVVPDDIEHGLFCFSFSCF